MNSSDNRKKIIKSYLLVASKATFTHFTAKKKEEITAESVNITTPNALALMRIWVISYNQISSTKRSTVKLMKQPKTASVMFKNIYDVSTALRKANHQYTVSSITTLGDYARSAQSATSNLVKQGSNNEDNDDEEEDEGKDNEYDEEEDKGEDNDEEEDEEIEGSDAVSEEYSEKDKPEEERNAASTEVDFYSNLLKAKAKQRILSGNVPARINIPLPNNATTSLSHILLRQAEELLYEKDLNADKLELLKLCLSRIVNLLNPEHTTLCRKIIPNTMYEEITKECDRQQHQFECMKGSDGIGGLFDELLQFQFDKNSEKVLSYLDEKKYFEKDKDSEHYKLLRIVESVIHDFKAWMKEEDLAEGTYVRKFANILDILLENEDITAYDGETFSTATKFMQILDENEENSGRRIDLMTKTKYNQVNIELCAIEYKILNANDNVFMQQQSKNMRTNSCILGNINNITKKSTSNILYMDWKGRQGYLAQIFRFKDVMVSQYVDSLYIPKELMELDDFRITLRYLYLWRDNMIKLSNETKLAAYKENRKFIVSDVSTSHKSFVSPPRSPSQRPLITPFFTPTNKRTREVMEKEE
jgi:hypothetical protein